MLSVKHTNLQPYLVSCDIKKWPYDSHAWHAYLVCCVKSASIDTASTVYYSVFLESDNTISNSFSFTISTDDCWNIHACGPHADTMYILSAIPLRTCERAKACEYRFM